MLSREHIEEWLPHAKEYERDVSNTALHLYAENERLRRQLEEALAEVEFMWVTENTVERLDKLRQKMRAAIEVETMSDRLHNG